MSLLAIYRRAFTVDYLDMNADSLFTKILKFSFGFWAVEFLISGSLWVALSINTLEYLPIKIAASATSFLLTVIISHIIIVMRSGAIPKQIVVVSVLSLISSLVSTMVDHILFKYSDISVGVEYNIENFCYSLFYGMSLFFGWSCFLIAYMFHLKVVSHERRLHKVREEALNSKLQALYYQLNPHFLFNALNSVIGLIEEGASAQAARTAMALSSFLRRTLERDPLRDLTLAEELALQSEYLVIEKERFSDRINIAIHLPHDLEDALIPSLILQPLIENAVKHGLHRSSEDLTIVITASREENRLQLSVDNISEAAAIAPIVDRPGLGVGLANIASRIEARFPEGGSLVAGPVTASHFRATLIMPLRLA